VIAVRRLIGLASVAGLMLLGLVAAPGPVQAKVSGPNGRIAFSRFDPALGGSVTYTVNPDGSHVQQLFPRASNSPHWSPDGSEVAIFAADADGQETLSTVIVNPDNGTFRELLMPDPTLFTGCTVWSPDGTRLACEGGSDTDPSREGIYTIRSSDGGGLKRVTSNPGGHDIPGDYSPNGKRLVFLRVDQNDQVGLFVVKLDGGGLRQITPPGAILNGEENFGSWSPHGNQVLFAMRTAPDRRYSIWVVHSDGSGLLQIPITPSCGGAFSNPRSTGCFGPGWSPDGTKIVFARVTAGGTQTNIYTVNPDGSGLSQVTYSGGDDRPDWGTHPLAT
jgi:TolB protein